MFIAKFWQKSEPITVISGNREVQTHCWGWSNESTSEAKQVAEKRAALLKGKQIQNEKSYEYSNAPLREILVDEGNLNDNIGSYLTTINSYGALILNTSNIMFVDVDIKIEKSGGFFKSLFGKGKSNSRNDEEIRHIEILRNFLKLNSSMGFRVYRTHSGLRYLETSQTHDPQSDNTRQILAKLGSDPKYNTLTQKQKSFRARLTPKPWRINLNKPPVHFPFESLIQERQHTDWQNQYKAACKQYSTCVLLEKLGNENDAITKVVEIHDRATKVGSNLALA